MRVRISSSCAIGLAIALLLGATPTARAQQQEPRRTTSSRRIPVTKDRPARPAPTSAPATARVNQDSIAAAERARQDSIAAAAAAAAAAERNQQDDRARRDLLRERRPEAECAAIPDCEPLLPHRRRRRAPHHRLCDERG